MFESLFSPLRINGVTIKNRLMVPAMVTNLSTGDGMCTPMLVSYHEAKAKGGWGLILTEDYAVAPEGRGYRCVPGLWTENQMQSHKAIPQAVHQYEGARVFAQIYHCGRQTRPALNGGYQPVSASAIPCPFCGCMPRELTVEEIKEIVRQFADAAERAKKAGFDGIELHGAHGYLIAQFMSPYSNKRVDEYGGGLMQRLRFPLEIISAVRERVGADYPIGFRISADEKMPGGRNLEDTIVIARILEEHGVDILNVSVGVYGNPTIAAPMQFPHGCIVEFSEKVKKAVNIPTIAVNRITDPRMANGIIEMGRADVVAMGRASLADPELPNKTRAGDTDAIRSCIGCLVCDNSLVRDTHIRCSVNSTLSYEYEGGILKTNRPKKVYVVGAGPAGMEAARAAAIAGHEVHVFEKRAQPGGEFRAAAFPPYKGEHATIIAWQWRQLKKLGVDIRFNTCLTADLIREGKPDRVIVATGAKRLNPSIPGIDKEHVVSAFDVLVGDAEVGDSVIVAGGGSVGVETACHLGMQHKNVMVVEMLDSCVMDEDSRIREQDYKLMEELGVEPMECTKVVEIVENGVILEREGKRFFKPADNVVAAFGYIADNTIYEEFAKVCPDVTVAGDARQARKLVNAMREGYLAGTGREVK